MYYVLNNIQMCSLYELLLYVTTVLHDTIAKCEKMREKRSNGKPVFHYAEGIRSSEYVAIIFHLVKVADRRTCFSTDAYL